MIAEAVLVLAMAYAGSGLLFGIAFVTIGVATVDAAARGSSIAFRLFILPGTIALWPLLAVKWLRASRHGEHA